MLRTDRFSVMPTFAIRKPIVVLALSAGIQALVFLVDLALPRGATAAIGYCVVPVLVGSTQRRGALIGATAICVLLAWLGYFLEPTGAAPWTSIFDRAVVTAVLCAAAVLSWRRARELNALEAAKRELEEANGQLQTFAAVVAHDIRGPLNTIGLYNELACNSRAVQRDPECLSSLASVRNEVNRMARLIERLLRYAQSGALTLDEFDAAAVLAEVREGLRAQIDAAGAEVSHDALPVLRADRTLVAEVFQNLIENAIKYRGRMPPRIHVSAERAQPTEWAFSVRDNGIGIAEDSRTRIFEAFQQGDLGMSRGGIGMGLATCKRIVERHGGRIDVQSTPGVGSTFSFTLRAGDLVA